MTDVAIDAKVVELAIGRLEMRPGDTLVLRVDLPVITSELAKRLEAIALSRLPEGTKVLVLDSRVRLSVVPKPETMAP